MGSVLWTLWTLLALTTGTVRSEKEEPETTSKPEQHRSSFECPFSVSPHQVDSSSAAEAAGVADDATADDDLAWCLPKGYNKQRPDFASKHRFPLCQFYFVDGQTALDWAQWHEKMRIFFDIFPLLSW